MRNIHITPTTIVPKEIRLEIYKETLEKIKSGELSNQSEYPYGLCRFLPQVLWNIDLNDPAPNGEKWTVESAHRIFPELGRELLRLRRNGDYLSPQERLRFLERTTHQLKT